MEIEATARLGGFWGAYTGDKNARDQPAAQLDAVAQREMKAMGLIRKTVTLIIALEIHDDIIADSTKSPPTLRKATNTKELLEYLTDKYQKDAIWSLLQRSRISGPRCYLRVCGLDGSTLLLGVTGCRRRLSLHPLTGFVLHVRPRGAQPYPGEVTVIPSVPGNPGLAGFYTGYRLTRYTPGARISLSLLTRVHLASLSSSGNENKRSTSCGLPWGIAEAIAGILTRICFSTDTHPSCTCLPALLHEITNTTQSSRLHFYSSVCEAERVR
jgi:hypothetical protein